MNNNYPNPWNFSNTDNQLTSENGSNKIEYYELHELGMGAPVGGKCYWIDSDGKQHLVGEWCGGPPIWSTKGSQVAIPLWTRKFLQGAVQQIAVLDIETCKLTRFKKTFAVLDLRSFDGNEIFGYDSPMHNRKNVLFELHKAEIDNVITI